jgi:hypothetical protein
MQLRVIFFFFFLSFLILAPLQANTMDATHRIVCDENLFNPLTSMGMQVSCILVISHFFHLVLKALGQPGPIAQIFVSLQIQFELFYLCL